MSVTAVMLRCCRDGNDGSDIDRTSVTAQIDLHECISILRA